MASPAALPRLLTTTLPTQSFTTSYSAWSRTPRWAQHSFSSQAGGASSSSQVEKPRESSGAPSSFNESSSDTSASSGCEGSAKSSDTDSTEFSRVESKSLPKGWEDHPDWSITKFAELPHRTFGYNQHIKINEDFKESLRQMLWTFKAPIRYAFAYGSGVFSQSSGSSSDSLSPHPHPPDAIVKWQKNGQKIIDFIFGVSHTQHWHSLNLTQNPHHYSFLGKLGSGAVSYVQDRMGAGIYYNPYITVNGTMIKYGVVNLDTLRRDLSQWDTLYLAGRLQKPVKILRDHPKVRLAHQINLISALRTSLLMLGPRFSETELYTKIAGISYMGDPRMNFKGEDPNKVRNIVRNQLPNFRQLYAPLIDDLPNVAWNDSRCKSRDWMLDPECDCAMVQDMDPVRRGNIVRRVPNRFRQGLYKEYQKKWQIPGREFDEMMENSKDEDDEGFRKPQADDFDIRIAGDADVRNRVVQVIHNTIYWPSTTQSMKGFLTAGWSRSWKYVSEKRKKGRLAVRKEQ